MKTLIFLIAFLFYVRLVRAAAYFLPPRDSLLFKYPRAVFLPTLGVDESKRMQANVPLSRLFFGPASLGMVLHLKHDVTRAGDHFPAAAKRVLAKTSPGLLLYDGVVVRVSG
jgi:hypothetical protein